MALTKQELLELIETSCTEQGTVAVPGPVLKELVTNYIPENVEAALIADLGDSATGAEIATAVNSIIDALQANRIVATE